ncbi:MAG: ankyrin repeat domain-containing protein [Archangium sp.]
MTADQKLLHAALTGHLAGVLVALDEGANLEARDDLSRTPLHCAVEGGHLEIVDALIARKADLTSKSYADFTVLHFAAREGHVAIARRLIEAGAATSERVINDVLTVSTMSTKGRPEITQLLRDAVIARAQPTAAAAGDATTRLIVAAHDGAIDTVREALQAGADVNARDGRGMEALSWACLRGHAEVAAELLKAGAKIDGLNGSGWPPIGQACGQGHVKVLELLLAKGANATLAFDGGKTALLCGLHQGFPEIVKTLVAAGARATGDELCEALGEGSFRPSVWQALGAAAQVLASDGSAPICVAAKTGQLEVVRALLDGGASPDFVDGAKRSALMFAAFQGAAHVVILLVERGASLNLVSTADFTALDYALKGAEPAIAELLFSRGAKMGDVPSVLSFVADNGNVELAKILLAAAKPKLDSLDANGVGALHYAVIKGHVALAALLVANGATSGFAMKNGTTALQLAERSGNPAMLAALKN